MTDASFFVRRSEFEAYRRIPGNANLPIGVTKTANREIGDPGLI
jgi:hypothetical protein